MSDTSAIALPREERDARFRTAFSKRLDTLAQPQTSPDPDDLPFQLPPHDTGLGKMPFKKIEAIASAHKQKTGGMVMLFHPYKGHLMLTARGIFFTPLGGTNGHFFWSTLDFMALPDLASDDMTFRVERDIGLIDKCVTIRGQFPLAILLWTIPVWLSIRSCSAATGFVDSVLTFLFAAGFMSGYAWGVPIIAGIIAKLRRTALRKEFRGNPQIHNVIAIGSQRSPQKILFDQRPDLQNIVICFKLALNIYRAQQMKYGPVSDD
jgi:hypothetical protein